MDVFALSIKPVPIAYGPPELPKPNHLESALPRVGAPPPTSGEHHSGVPSVRDAGVILCKLIIGVDASDFPLRSGIRLQEALDSSSHQAETMHSSFASKYAMGCGPNQRFDFLDRTTFVARSRVSKIAGAYRWPAQAPDPWALWRRFIAQV